MLLRLLVILKNNYHLIPIIDETVPTEIQLNIIPKKEIEKARGKDVFAYASYNKPCKIYMPAGMKIKVHPLIKQAEWISEWEANSFAHEIIHCIRGKWHQ